MKALYFVDYPTSGWQRDCDYSATQFIKTLKGIPYRAKGPYFSFNGKSYTWTPTQQQKVLEIFGEITALGIEFKGPRLLIPVPGSDCFIGNPRTPLALDIANAIVSKKNPTDDLIPCDILRWDAQMRSSRTGGPRQAHELYPHLRHLSVPPNGRKIILIDDVLTSGGHIQACSAYLYDQFGLKVHSAIFVGRTQTQPSPKTFDWRVEQIADYTHPTDLDWLLS